MKIFLTSIFIMTTTVLMADTVKLPNPEPDEKSLSMVETLRTRHSVRDFDAKRSLTMQQISNLCWAACGISRDAKHITAPSAMNRQEIRLFVFTEEGVFEYNAGDNTLEGKVMGDYRKLIAGQQEFVMDAPVSLLMVIDFDKLGSAGERAMMMGCVDAGNVSENINLYCQSVGLATVPRASMDTEAISNLLKFNKNQLPIMNNPVGYEKK